MGLSGVSTRCGVSNNGIIWESLEKLWEDHQVGRSINLQGWEDHGTSWAFCPNGFLNGGFQRENQGPKWDIFQPCLISTAIRCN